MQEHLNHMKKVVQEDDTLWINTFLVLQYLFQERQSVGTTIAALTTDVKLLSSVDYTAAACLQLQGPFYQATMELLEETRVLA